ncbi:MAG: ATPase, T2SS/T4P/T4SS family [Candidatus Krumholzibacteriia bacterium]
MASNVPELGDLLVQLGLIDQQQLRTGLDEQSRTRERLGEILMRQTDLSPQDLVKALAMQGGFECFDASRHAVTPQALDAVPITTARRHHVLPIELTDEVLTVAVPDPQDVVAMDELRGVACSRGRRLKVLVGAADELDEQIDSHYSRIEGTRVVSDLMNSVATEAAQVRSDDVDEDEIARSAQDAGVVKLVNQILEQALADRATDIHVEPQEKGLNIRYRVDGMLYNALTPPRAVFMGLVSRIKILSNLDIAERRATQDGRFSYRGNGREVDVRVSIIPTIHGEKLVLRLLDKTAFNYKLRDLGFSEVDYKAFADAIRRPYGMILLSGPTGSGKSTTLYAGLLELRDDTLNIITVEDPVEYQIGRINQVQVNPRKSVTFATALRSFLRQDPDVIMVGEIRDQDTAEIAVRAALTGHMVFSTIHANDAPSTATRLVSMGVEPFMAASAMTMVAAQRLVRRTCPYCQVEYEPDEETVLALGGPDVLMPDGKIVWKRGTGCVACRKRGYLGRVAIIERMMMSTQLRQMVAENRPAAAIRERALQEGMVTLRQSGIQKAREGTTTLEEVLRVSLSDE